MALQDRMLRAVRGEVALFEEVENDQTATTEALIIVAIGAISLGIGAALGTMLMGSPAAAAASLVGGVLNALIGWAVFSGLTFFIGTRLFGAEATWEEVLRTLGYAYTPMVIGFVGIIPIIGWLVVAVAGLWALYLAFVAIRSALDVDTGKTIATILLSIAAVFIISYVLQLVVRF